MVITPWNQPRTCSVQFSSVQFSHSVVSDSVTPSIAACQASLSITNSWSLPKLMCIKSVMPSSHLILCRPLFLLPSTPPSPHLNAEFQTIAKRDQKAFISDQCKEIEENNRMGKTRDLFKKIRDTKGTFHAKMGTIKDRNGMDLKEASLRNESLFVRSRIRHYWQSGGTAPTPSPCPAGSDPGRRS